MCVAAKCDAWWSQCNDGPCVGRRELGDRTDILGRVGAGSWSLAVLKESFWSSGNDKTERALGRHTAEVGGTKDVSFVSFELKQSVICMTKFPTVKQSEEVRLKGITR